MRGIVQSRPFVKKKTKIQDKKNNFSFFSSKKNKRGNNIQPFFSQRILIVAFLSLLFLFFAVLIFKGTWYHPVTVIENIKYSDKDKSVYYDTELYVWTSKFLRGKSYNSLKIFGTSKLLAHIQSRYPFVEGVKIAFVSDNTVAISFSFTQPNFLVKIGDQKYGIWSYGKSFPLLDSWSLGSTGFVVDTPSYLSGTRSLSGFFFEVEPEWYQRNIPLIQKNFPSMDRFVYLVGSMNFLVFENGKMIFFNKNDLQEQFKNLVWLQKYYQKYEKLSMINLGSLKKNKVIVR